MAGRRSQRIVPPPELSTLHTWPHGTSGHGRPRQHHKCHLGAAAAAAASVTARVCRPPPEPHNADGSRTKPHRQHVTPFLHPLRCHLNQATAKKMHHCHPHVGDDHREGQVNKAPSAGGVAKTKGNRKKRVAADKGQGGVERQRRQRWQGDGRLERARGVRACPGGADTTAGREAWGRSMHGGGGTRLGHRRCRRLGRASAVVGLWGGRVAKGEDW